MSTDPDRPLFGSGDLVQLKSGGPRMTVVDLDETSGYRQYKCQWFAGGSLKEAMFKGIVLRRPLPFGEIELE